MSKLVKNLIQCFAFWLHQLAVWQTFEDQRIHGIQRIHRNPNRAFRGKTGFGERTMASFPETHSAVQAYSLVYSLYKHKVKRSLTNSTSASILSIPIKQYHETHRLSQCAHLKYTQSGKMSHKCHQWNYNHSNQAI